MKNENKQLLVRKKELSTIGNQTVHRVSEYIKHHNDFCFDILDVLESPQNILNHYGICIDITGEGIQMIQKELMKLAEEFQTAEMVKRHGKESNMEQTRRLK